jgi:hypothetical protein
VFPVGDTQITLQNSADFNIGPADDPTLPNFVVGAIQDNGGLAFDIYGASFMTNGGINHAWSTALKLAPGMPA